MVSDEIMQSLGVENTIENKLAMSSAFEWINENTTLEVEIESDESINALPSCAKLFAIKFCDLLTINRTVTSESIEGLSQSFTTESNWNLLWELAYQLLLPYLKSTAVVRRGETIYQYRKLL